MRYLSLFSGVGGFELGIQRAFDNSEITGLADVPQAEGVQDSTDTQERNGRHIPTCIGYSEIDKYAIETYERNFNGHRNYGDATLINERELPDFDLLVGGFPCQAFSVAGKRHGFADTRGTLFFDIARILAHKRPRHFLLENVKGLLSHDSGKTFQTILGVLTDIGYDVEWQVLNAKDFGVPQNRERIFIVGHLRGECGRQVFPIGGNAELFIEECGRPLPSLTVNDYKGPSKQRASIVVDTPAIRRLTPVEAERLMSWPDGWTIGSDTQRYKQCGNGVVSNVVQAVIENMKGCLR